MRSEDPCSSRDVCTCQQPRRFAVCQYCLVSRRIRASQPDMSDRLLATRRRAPPHIARIVSEAEDGVQERSVPVGRAPSPPCGAAHGPALCAVAALGGAGGRR